MESLLAFLNVLAGYAPHVLWAAPLIALVIDLAKRAGLKDGYAPLISGLVNLVLFAIIYFVGNEDKVKSIVDAVVGFAPVILPLALAVLSAPKWHEWFKAVGIGYSHPDPVGG